jgi:hypothetical protein
MMSRVNNHIHKIPPTFLPVSLGLAVIYATMLSRFDISLLFSDTILTGGDSASWLQPLVALRDEFLPRLRYFGYSHSNFYGYLEGQHYFPLPFLVAAFLSYAMPVTVALKLVTVAGAFALPLTMFFSVRSFARSSWMGLVGAALGLLFLFNESYSMFGGNFLSTFAGEFCYSWALAFFPLFVASAWNDHCGKSWSARSGLLLGLIGLCHFFVFMPAFFLPFFFAFQRRHIALPFRLPKSATLVGDTLPELEPCPPEALVLRIPLTYLIGLSLMAFWFLPMAGTRTWAQSISMIWHFSSFMDFARQTLMPVWAGAAVLALMVVLWPQSPLGRMRRKAAYILYGLGACAFMFFASVVLEVPDIRFVPQALILSIFSASLFLRDSLASAKVPGMPLESPGKLEKTGKHRKSGKPGIADKRADKPAGRLKAVFCQQSTWAFLVTALSCLGAVLLAHNGPAWFSWNYSGYQSKSEWVNLKGIADAYQGGIMDGRILWEKQDQNDNKDFGSERGFENLYYFTGRPTSEGIHYGSSFMARATTYLQSTYSLNPVDPEADRLHSRLAPEAWPLRFTQANAQFIIAHSPQVKALFRAHAAFRLDRVFGKFEVFEYSGYPGSYIEIPDAQALSIIQDSSGGFKTDFYRFFRDHELIRRPFVPASFADAALEQRVAGRFDSYDDLHRLHTQSDEWQGYPTSPSAGFVQEEQIDGFDIVFTTDSPGAPHIIKASFAPGWRSRGGETVYPVAPGFMLVFPESNRIHLEYRRTALEWVGLVISFLVLPGILLGFGHRRLNALRTSLFKPLFILAFVIFFAAVGAFIVLSASGTSTVQADIRQAQSLNLGDPQARVAALALVEPYATMEYLERYDNRLTFEAYRIKAEVLVRSGKVKEAQDLLTLLRTRYAHVRDLSRLPR